jgi:hypothetical protein
MIEGREPLSLEGCRRREAILQVALGTARRRRRRVRALRAGAALAVALCAGLIVWRVGDRGRVAPVVVEKTTRSPIEAPRVAIARVETEYGLSDRWAIEPQGSTVRRLSDGELLERLSADGRPAGLAYIEGRAVVFVDGRRVGG